MNKHIINLLNSTQPDTEDNSSTCENSNHCNDNILDINISILEHALAGIKSDELIALARKHGIQSRTLFYELWDLYLCTQWFAFNEMRLQGKTKKYEELFKLELLLEKEVKQAKILYFKCLNIEKTIKEQTSNYVFGTNSKPTDELTKKIRLSAFNNISSINPEKEYEQIINERINNFVSANYKYINTETLIEGSKSTDKVTSIQKDNTFMRRTISDPTCSTEPRGTRDIYYLNSTPDPRLLSVMDLFIQRSGGYYEIPNTTEGWLENKITLTYFPGYTLCSRIENELATITKGFARGALLFGKQVNNLEGYEINSSIKKASIPYDFETEELIAKAYSMDPLLGDVINAQMRDHSQYLTNDGLSPIKYRLIKLFIDYLEISIVPALKTEFVK